MTKSELVSVVSGRFPQLLRVDAEIAVDEILGAIAQALASGGRIEIRGFGVFSLNYRPPRVGRNPRTGEKFFLPRNHTPHFKAGKMLRQGVNAQR